MSSPSLERNNQNDALSADPSFGLAELLQPPGWSKLGAGLVETALGDTTGPVRGAKSDGAKAAATGSNSASASDVAFGPMASDGNGAPPLKEIDSIGPRGRSRSNRRR